MILFLNAVWLIFGGAVAGFSYILSGICLCLTVIGFPFGIRAIQLGVLRDGALRQVVFQKRNGNWLRGAGVQYHLAALGRLVYRADAHRFWLNSFCNCSRHPLCHQAFQAGAGGALPLQLPIAGNRGTLATSLLAIIN